MVTCETKENEYGKIQSLQGKKIDMTKKLDVIVLKDINRTL